MTIELRAVTRDNFEDVIDLKLHEHQRKYLASNTFSIAEASFFPHYTTRAIYHLAPAEMPAEAGQDEAAGAELVGFLMYVSLAEDGQPGEYAIWRFMMDAAHQGKGYGRRAMELMLAEIRSKADVKRITISYLPENPVARDFYGSFGFVETGIDDEDEMVAEIIV